MVKQQLGSDAVILHTRTYKRGGVLGVGGRTVVEVTAADGKLLSRRQARRTDHVRAKSDWPSYPAWTSKKTSSEVTALPGRSGPVVSTTLKNDITAGDLIRKTYAVARDELKKQQERIEKEQQQERLNVMSQSPPSASEGQVEPLRIAGAPDPDQLADEMKSVKRMVARMMRQQHCARMSRRKSTNHAMNIPEKLFDQYVALLEQEVAEELAEEVISQVREKMSQDDIQSEQTCRQAVLQAIAGLMPTDAHANTSRPTPDGRPRTIALIGPTGVGKTTTIAKLAANFKLKQNKSVALITLDTYRIAAVDQLRTYAAIIGVPLHVVLSRDELVQAQQKCLDADIVLIDTAGRSQKDDQKLKELADFIDAATPHEVHLVLSSTCSQQVLLQTIERFSDIRTDRIIFTKLDEAVTCGVLLNVARKVNKKLSYITTGQEVPHHIEAGQPDRLAAWVLGVNGS